MPTNCINTMKIRQIMTQHFLSHFFVIGPCDLCMRYCETCKVCECVIRADEMLAMENAAVADSWYEYE